MLAQRNFRVILFFTLMVFNSFAEVPAPGQSNSTGLDVYAGLLSMNGFKLSDFSGFFEKWKLVTVRYREDSKEMRFVYANSLAQKAMEQGFAEYPDGAVFAKIGLVTERDKSFPSSVVPSGAKRYQFMIRDKVKFKKTSGWGYVLFNGEGKTFSGNPDKNTLACAACHQIAKDRDYVFSAMIQYEPFIEKMQRATDIESSPLFKASISFKTVKRTDLPARVARFIPMNFSRVRILNNAFRENMFEGTLNEVAPLLASDTLTSGLPSVLTDDLGNLFSFSYLQKKDPTCTGAKTRMFQMRNIPTNSPVKSFGTDEVLLRTTSYCLELH